MASSALCTGASFVHNLSDTLLWFRQSKLLCDTMLTVNDDQGDSSCLWAHSIVLAAASDMMLNAFMDSKSSLQWCRFRVELSGCDPVAVEVVLNYLYTGRLTVPSSSQNAEEFFTKIVAVFQSLGIPLDKLNGIKVVLGEWPMSESSSMKYIEGCSSISSDGQPNIVCSNHENCSSNYTDSQELFNLSDTPVRVHEEPAKNVIDDEQEVKLVDSAYHEIPVFNKQCQQKIILSCARKLVIRAKQHQQTAHNNPSTKNRTICDGQSDSCRYRKLKGAKLLQPKTKTGSNQFICSTCGRSCETGRRLRKHEFLHTTVRPYICHSCGKSYRFLGSLNQHSQMVHNCNSSSGSRLCESCGASFPSSLALRGHVRRWHAVRRHVCTKCKKRYRTNFQLEEHMRSCQSADGSKPYRCSRCGVSFTLRHNLRRHERLHDNLSGHTCPVCCKVFRQKYNVLQHARRMHSTHQAQDAKVAPTCGVCAKTFHSEAALQRHALMHVDGGRRFVCQTCKKAFTQMRYLTGHLVVHRDKQYVCSLCSRHFVHPSRLALHVKKKHSSTN